ncbi:MAG: CotH kinase family protein [Bacteroidetes bacterium]|nr:CotH kinase family protein [Bacteroidota bacterium]
MISSYFFNSKRFRFLLACLFLLIGSLQVPAQILINEIQTSNLTTIQDEYLQYDDWIELYNAGASAVNLNGYGLTDDSTNYYRFTFPSMSIASGGYLLIFASDTNKTSVNTHWETAVKENDTWKYRANTTAAPDTNWRNVSFNDGSWSGGTGGIGFGDTDDGTTVATCISVYSRKTFTIADTSKIFESVLNVDYDDGFVAYLNGVEIARVNVGTAGVRPAWNDLAPASREAVMYSGGFPDSFYLSKNVLRSLLRNGTNVLAVEVHNQTSTSTDLSGRVWLSFLVDNSISYFGPIPSWFHPAPVQYLHAKFKLNRAGEKLFLVDGSGNLLDSKFTGSIEPDNSLGRNPDGSSTWCISATPTPGTSNNSVTCFNGYATIPIFSLASGFYPVTQSLVLSTSFPNSQIRYSLDGTDVTSSSTLYTGPISLSTTTTVKARVFSTSALASQTVTSTFFINLNCRLPVYALTTDPYNLYDYNNGIFVEGPNAQASSPHFGANYWMDWEKPIYLEYFDRDKIRAFKFNSGLKITGGWSRMADQKSLEIMLSDKYGLSKLNYPLESDKTWNDKWDDFILHTTGNDRGVCHMRDPMMERLLKPTNIDYLAYEPCLLYINGQSWGVYYTRENDDHHWIEGNYGYKKDEIDLLKESYFYPTIEVKKGSDAAFWTMYNYATTSSPSGASYYSTMATMMDIENMVDYFASETYYPNDDWMGGGNNNLKMWRPTKAGGRFRYLSYDLDFGMGLVGSVSNDMLGTALNPSPHNYNSDIFQKLVQNPAYKRYFINRYADLINTIWLPSNVQSMAYLFRDSLRRDMHFQYEKWGGGDTNQWISNIASMLTFANQRPAYARNYIQSHFSMTSQVTLTIQASPAGSGRIQISTVTPTSYPWSGVYFNGNPVTITAIPNPGYTFDHWRSNTVINTNDPNQVATYNFTTSDVITAYFTGSPVPVQLQISEINYNSDSATNTGDWIELYNPSNSPLDISGWKFRDGADNHTFTFPAPTTIAANGYLVVASDLAKFSAINPTVTNVVGSFGFDFDNGGEDLRLYDNTNTLYTSVLYDDFSPWPLTPDGQGYTLERIFPVSDPNDGNSWFAGCFGGSPGRAYSSPTVTVTAGGSTTICQGSTVSLTANASPGYTFQWKNNGTDIPGANQSSYTASQAGSYTVAVSSSGCSGISSPVTVSVDPAGQVNSTTPASRCGNGSVTLSASGTTAIEWYDAASGGSLVGNGNNFTTPVLSQSFTYYAVSGGACPSARVPVLAGILATTAAPVTQDAGRCGSGTVVLSATDTATIHWYSAASGGTLLATGTTFTTPVLTQSTTYYVEAGTACPSARVPVSAIISSATATPVTSNVSRCGAGTVTLTATDTATIYWYSAASGGSLLATGASYTTPSISSTTTYYVEAGAFCPSARISVQAIVNTIAAAPVTQNASRCGTGSVTLTATDTAAIRWYNAASGGTQVGSGTSFVTPSLSTTTTYYAEAGSVCPSARISAQAIINAQAAAPVTSDVSRCGNGTVTLTATDTAVVRWYSAATGGTLLFTGNSFTTPSLSTTTSYFAEAGSVCPSARVQANAIINTVTTAPVVQNASRCGSGTVVLTATSSSTVNWYNAPGGTLLGTGLSYTTPVISATTTYYAVAGTICPSNAISAQAIINAICASPVTQSANRCGTGTVTLTATDTASIRWYSAASGGSQLGTGTSFVTPSLSASTTYYAEAGSVCPSARIAAQAIINGITATPVASDVARCGTGTVTLTATDTATIRWYSVASGGTILATGTSFTTPVLSVTTPYYVEAGTVCPSARIQVNAIIATAAADPVVQNASRCGTGTVTLTANSAFTVNWYNTPGGTLLGTGASFTTPSISTTTTYYAQAISAGCQSNVVSAQAIINAIAAAPQTQGAGRCGAGSVTLTATDTAAIRWYAASSGGSVLGTGTSFVTPSLSVTTTYYAEAGSVCPSARIAAVASINATTAAPVVQNSSRCGNGTLTLTASDTAAIRWYALASGGSQIGSGTSFITPVLNQTTTYYVEAGSLCPSARVPVQAFVYAVAASPVTSNINRCGPGVVVLTASDTASIRWYNAASGGSLLFTGTTYTTPSLSTSTTYYIEAGSVCPSSRVAVTAGILTVAAAPVTTGANRCGAGSLQLTATDTAAIRWYDASTGGALVSTGNTFTTPVINQTVTYYAEAGSVCPSSRIPAQAIINAITAVPVAPDVARCGQGTIDLIASDTAVINWYDAISGGNLLASGTTYTTPSLTVTTTYYVEAGTICPSQRIAVNAIITTAPSDPVVADSSRCGDGTVTLTAVCPFPVSWYDAPGGNLLATGLTFTTPVLNQTTTYYTQSGAGSCLSAVVAGQAIVNAITADPTITGASRCGAGSVTLVAMDTAAVLWYDVISGGTIISTGPTFLTPSLTQSTTFYVQAGTVCPSPMFAVQAIINDVSPDPVVSDTIHCGPGSVTLTAIDTALVYWYNAAIGGSTLATGSTYTTPQLTQTTTYYLQAGGICPSQVVPLTVFINEINPDPVVTNASNCGSGSVTLMATDTASIYWYDALSGGNLVGTGPSFTTPVLSSTTVYYADAGSVCPSAFVPVTAEILSVPIVNLGNDTVLTTGFSLVLDAGAGFSGYLWSTTETTQAISVNASGIYNVVVTATNGCTSGDTIEVTITTDIQENSGTGSVLVYPNPTHDLSVVQFPKSSSAIRYVIYNASGQVVYSDEVHAMQERTQTLHVENWARGVYFIEVLRKEKPERIRLLIQ